MNVIIVDREQATSPLRCDNAQPILKQGVRKSSTGIPLIIHQIYKDTNLPIQYVELMKGCRKINKEFVHVLWTDADFERFLEEKKSNWMSLYSKYKIPSQRSDFMRLLILEHFGGVYFDLDMECRKPLLPTINALGGNCIIDKERELQSHILWDRTYNIQNSLIMAVPGHPFIRFYLSKLEGALKATSVHFRTGLILLTSLYEEYVKMYPSGPDAVVVAPPKTFSPFLDTVAIQKLRTLCKSNWKTLHPLQAAACGEWVGQGQNQVESRDAADSTLIHRFMHLVYTFGQSNIKQRSNACENVQSLLVYKME